MSKSREFQVYLLRKWLFAYLFSFEHWKLKWRSVAIKLLAICLSDTIYNSTFAGHHKVLIIWNVATSIISCWVRTCKVTRKEIQNTKLIICPFSKLNTPIIFSCLSEHRSHSRNPRTKYIFNNLFIALLAVAPNTGKVAGTVPYYKQQAELFTSFHCNIPLLKSQNARSLPRYSHQISVTTWLGHIWKQKRCGSLIAEALEVW